jgi:hypothetical protein
MPCPQNPPLGPLLSQMNSFCILVIDISEIHFNIFLVLAPLSSFDAFQPKFYIIFISPNAWYMCLIHYDLIPI